MVCSDCIAKADRTTAIIVKKRQECSGTRFRLPWMWGRMKSGIAFADELFKAPKKGLPDRAALCGRVMDVIS
jgi:hypothetical protein